MNIARRYISEQYPLSSLDALEYVPEIMLQLGFSDTDAWRNAKSLDEMYELFNNGTPRPARYDIEPIILGFPYMTDSFTVIEKYRPMIIYLLGYRHYIFNPF